MYSIIKKNVFLVNTIKHLKNNKAELNAFIYKLYFRNIDIQTVF